MPEEGAAFSTNYARVRDRKADTSLLRTSEEKLALRQQSTFPQEKDVLPVRPVNVRFVFDVYDCKHTVELILLKYFNALNGAGCRNRTRDLLITNQLLYQLS